MRILIDLQSCQSGSRTRGIGRYSISLAQAIAKRARSHEVWILVNALLGESESLRASFDTLVDKNNIITFRAPGPTAAMFPQNHWRQHAAELIREHMLDDLRPDVVHLSSLFEGFSDDSVTTVKSAVERSTAVTFYDAIPFMRPDAYLGDQNVRTWYFEKIESLKRADLLLAISDSTRREAIDELGIAQDRVVNISAAVDNKFRRINLANDVAENLRRKYGLTRPFIMYAGVMEERKNVAGLIQAFSLLPPGLRRRYQLAVVCQATEITRMLLAELTKKCNLSSDEVVVTGFVTDDELIALYSLCHLFVLPSLHEGFGLPALEAMACGAPTIGSNCSSIPEAIGKPDALFDPTQPESIANRINQALTDDAYIEALREHAEIQAQKFSWDNTAGLALAAFEALHERKRDVKRFSGSGPHKEPRKGDSDNSIDEWSYHALIDGIVAIDVATKSTEVDWVLVANSIGANLELVHLRRHGNLPSTIKWRVEGPFDSSYSLALLNRETARALADLGHEVALHSTEGPGDFEPNAGFLSRHHDLRRFHEQGKSLQPHDADVVSRNLYPPRVHDLTARINLLHHYAWEESGFPQDWVDSFNTHLQGMTSLSTHVEKVLLDNGVTVPMTTSGCGVDHWEKVQPNETYRIAGRQYRFLHVSSCFPRKGMDVLLEAYGRAFRSTDDVTLIIKTFENPHNDVRRQVQAWKAADPGYPDVGIVEADLSDADLKSLYQQCHALVAPSRAEGFGLPLAEAILSGLPVITTAWGGQMAFCDHSTSWLVDYQFEYTRAHFNLFDSVWANPVVEDLAATLRQIYATPPAEVKARVDAGRRKLLAQFRWSHVASRLVEHTRTVSARMAEPMHCPKVGWITTWNTRCGIAAYSAHLMEHFPQPVAVLAPHADDLTAVDTGAVRRCWRLDEADDLAELAQMIERTALDTLVVQFNYGFFDFQSLSVFLSNQADAGRTVFIVLHSTSDPLGVAHKRLSGLVDALSRCDRILVHSVNDLNTLKALGLINNVCLFPHGLVEKPPSPVSFTRRHRRVIASYGFFLPHKGLLDLIEAVAKLVSRGEDVHLLMVNAEYPVRQSAELIEECKRKIKRLGLARRITLLTEFLSDEDCLGWLAQADLVIFPYQSTGESSSAAVRIGLASKKPVAVTPVAVFDDVRPAVFTLPGTSTEDLAAGIAELLHELDVGGPDVTAVMQKAERWREAHRHPILSQRLWNMLVAIGQKKRQPDLRGAPSSVWTTTSAHATDVPDQPRPDNDQTTQSSAIAVAKTQSISSA